MKRKLAFFLTITVTLMVFSSMPMTAFAAGKGDFNGDGYRNTLDVRNMLSVLLSSQTPTRQQIWWGDYDASDSIDTSDARVLLTELLGYSGSAAIDYAKPTGEDYWGERSITLLGDSISFGVGTSNDATTSGSASDLYNMTGGIPEYSYVSYVKKAVQAANGGSMNYGFTSAYPTAWPGVARSEEIHSWPTRDTDSSGSTAWVCDNNDSGDRLTSVGMTCTSAWKTITYTLREAYVNEYSYFCVYYQSEPDAGMFCIADGNGGEVANVNGSKSYVNTASTDGTSKTMRTAFYKLSDCYKNDDGAPQIIICHDGTTKPVTITGIGYYKDISEDTITFNSFTRGGISLINLSETVLDQATSADTFIMGLGYNDFCFNHVRVNNGEFAAQIDKLIELCNAKGTQVIVNDYAWENPVVSDSWTESQRTAHAIVKSELKRFATETGGIYIDQQGIYGDAILATLNDGSEIGANSSKTTGDNVHPNNEGHKMIAQNVVAALGLEWTEAWT